MDVTRDASVADGFARILAAGHVDILMNNAAPAQKTHTL